MNDKLVGVIDSILFFLFWYVVIALFFQISLVRHNDILLLLLVVSLLVAWRGFRLNPKLRKKMISCWDYTLDGAKWGGLSLFSWVFIGGVNEVYASGGHLDGADLLSIQFLKYMAIGGGLFGTIGVFLGGANAFPLYFLNRWLNATNKRMLQRP